MKWGKAIVIFFLLLGSRALAQEVIFFKEDITFRLSGKYFYVDGTYWFSNSSRHEVQRLIYYPFPAAGKSGSVDSMDVFDLSKGAEPEISNRTDAGFSFILKMSSHDTSLYHIAYRQKLNGDSAMYILRTTQAWNRPLEYAEYRLMIGDSIDVTGFSYDPDKVYTIEGNKIYLWKRVDFMPEKDFVIHFKSNL